MKFIKEKGIFILAALNIFGVMAGAIICFTSMSAVVGFFTEQKDMSLEEYLAVNKVFPDKPILYTLQPFTVNLSNDEEEKVVQLEVNLEIIDEIGYDEIITKKAFVRDTVVKILAEKKSQDLSSIQGKLYLKDDITMAVNDQLQKGFVKGVYFSKFFIQ